MCDMEIFRLRVNHLPRSRNNQSFERTSRRPQELKPKPTQTLTPSAHSSVHWRFVLVTAVVLRAVTATETLWPCWLGPRLRRGVEICCQLVTKIHQLSVLISLRAAGASADSRVDRFLLVVLCKHVRLPFPLCSPAERPQIFTASVKHHRAADGTTTTQSGPAETLNLWWASRRTRVMNGSGCLDQRVSSSSSCFHWELWQIRAALSS